MNLPTDHRGRTGILRVDRGFFGQKSGVLDVGFGWKVKDALRLERAELLEAWCELAPLYRVLRSVS